MYVSASIKGFAKAARFGAQAGFVCGNIDTGCAQQVIAVLTNVAAIATYVSDAVYFCQFSRLWCCGSSADVAVSVAFLVQNIYTGLELCSGVSFVHHLEPNGSPGESGEKAELQPGESVDTTEPEPGAPEPQPDQQPPGPQPGQLASFLPGVSLVRPARRLRGAAPTNATDGLDARVLGEARQQMQELGNAMDRFRLQLKQAVRRAELHHAVHGQPLPEPLRSLEGRIDNATAKAKASTALLSAQSTAEQMEEQTERLLAMFKDFELGAQPPAMAPLVI